MMRTTVFLGFAALAVAGCDKGGDEPPMEEEESRCAAEDRDEPFHLGLERDGEATKMVFTDAEPAEPIRGINKWTLDVTDLADAPVEGATLTVKPWMPDHGHGSPQPVVVEDVGDGQYVLDPVNLFMAGYWEITITTEMGDATDEAMFPFCVE